MNLPNKITVSRIVISLIILLLIIIPWYRFGISFPTFNVVGKLIIDSKYLIAGIFFIIASLSDIIDGNIARSKNMITDFGKVMDAIADNILINGVLIVLAYEGFISILIPVIIITRDTFVNAIRLISNNDKIVELGVLDKIKTFCMMSGISLMFFYNLPFQMVGIPVADVLIILASIFSIISGCNYYFKTKDLIFNER